MHQRVKVWKSRFWLWLYKLSGERVGHGADEYWDHHFDRIVRARLREIRGTSLGENLVKELFWQAPPAPPSRVWRDKGRNLRDNR